VSEYRADIAVVDDDVEVQDVIRLVLEREGYRVRTYASGEDVLAALEAQGTPDLLLLDVMMPGLDGHEVCRRIKGDPRWATLPIIMVTAKMDLQDVVRGLELGADDYVTKPFFYEELLARVRATLRAGEAERALTRKHQTLEALYAVTRATQSLQLETVLREALKQSCTVLKMDAGIVRSIDHDTKELVVAALEGLDVTKMLQRERIPIGGIHERVIQSGEPLVIPNVLTEPRIDDHECLAHEFHSLIMIPLIVPDRVIGTLSLFGRSVIRLEPEAFGFLRAIGQQLGVAVERARLFEATRQQAQELSVLNSVASSVSSSIELETVLQSALAQGVELTGAEAGTIRLFDPEQDELVLTVQAGRPLAAVTEHPRISSDLFTLINGALDRRVYRLSIPFLDRPFSQALAKGGIQEGLIVPLQNRDRLVGTMALFTGPGHPFRPYTDQLLLTLGHQIGVAVENALLHQSLQASEIKYRRLVEEIPEVVYEAAAGPLGQISYVSPGIETLTGYSVEEWSTEPSLWDRSLYPEDRERILAEFEWLWRHGGERQMEYRLVTKDGQLRWVTDRAKGLRDEHGQALSIEGILIDITQQKQSEARSARQNHELTVLNAVSRAVSQSLDLDEILRQALMLMVESLGFDAGIVHLLEQLSGRRSGKMSLRIHHGLEPGLIEQLTALDPGLFKLGRSSRAGEISQISLSALPELGCLRDAGFVSFVSVPLIAKEQALGFMHLLSRTPRELGENERRFFQSVGQQIGLAAQNAQLYQQVDQTLLARVQELLTLQAVAEIVNQSLDPAELLRGTLERVLALLQLPIGIVYEVDPASHCLWLRAISGAGMESSRLIENLPTPESYMRQVALMRKPMIVNDLSKFPPKTKAFREFCHLEQVNSFAGVPITVKGKVWGVLAGFGRGSRRLFPSEVQLLTAVAQQIGVAMENARLFDETRQHLQETQTLLRVSQTISSTLDPVEVLRRIARETGRSLGADMVGAYLLDADGSFLRPVAGYHVPKDLLQEFRDHPMPLKGHGFLDEGWETQRPVYTSDSAADLRIDRDWFHRFPHQSVLFIPMMIRKEKIGGIFAVWWNESCRFTPETLRLVDGISRQAAIAVENARLYRALSDQVQELQRLANEVLEESRGKEEFLMAISHELGTPLTAIKAYVDTLSHDLDLDPSVRQSFLGVVKNEVDRLSRLIGHVLDAARMEWGPIQLKRSPLDLAGLASEVVQEALSRRPISCLGGTSAWVNADRDRIKQVIVNLVDNAIKYSAGDQPVEVRVDCHDGQVVGSVRDYGVGVPPALRGVIFEKFKRVETGTTRETYGAGLGLYISRAIVEAHGGRIWVSSPQGQGSVFTFALPANLPGEESDDDDRPR
jgi:PAS domain S-box-containing protein